VLFGRKKKKFPEEADTLIKALFALDGLRVGVLRPELKDVHKNLKNLHFLSQEDVSWSYVRREINKVIDSPARSTEATRIIHVLPFLTVAVVVGVIGMIIMAFAALYIIKSLFLFRMLVIPLAVTAAVSGVRWYLDEKLREYFEKNVQRTEKIRNVNQLIINNVIKILKAKGFPLERCQFVLYNTDYANIKVKKNPTIYREAYLAMPTTDRAVNR
jgi:hypothetical protein